MMDATLKAKWVAALRSGEYQQAREILHVDRQRFCCLGVLCTLVPHVEFTGDDALYRDDEGDVHDADGELPLPVRDMSGISKDEMIHLIQMNDGKDDVRQHSFPEIADWIEANL
jgi:hypothetical protein